jgi:hypothetical protein
MGGGMAGVASKAENDSIKVYKDRQKYNEWEFVYDMKKDRRLGFGQTDPMGGGGANGPKGAAPGAPQGPGQPPQVPQTPKTGPQ